MLTWSVLDHHDPHSRPPPRHLPAEKSVARWARPLGIRTRPLGPWVRCLAKEKGTLSNMRSLAVPQRTLRSRRWAELSTPEDEAESSFTSKDPHRGISRHTYPPCNPCNVFVGLQHCKQVCLIASGLPPGRILESSSRWPVVMMGNCRGGVQEIVFSSVPILGDLGGSNSFFGGGPRKKKAAFRHTSCS